MTPITETEKKSEDTMWREQAARNAVSADNSSQWQQMQEYFKSLPAHQVKVTEAIVLASTQRTDLPKA